jgi:hypothetical protein
MKIPRILTSIVAAGVLCISAVAAHAQSSSTLADSSAASAPAVSSTVAPASASNIGLFPAPPPLSARLASGAAASSDSDSTPRIEVFAGYNFLSNDIAFQDSFGLRQGLNGYAASFTYYANKNIGFMADFSGNNGTATIRTNFETVLQHEDQYYLIFGPVVSHNIGHFRISANGGVGVARQRFSACSEGCESGKETNFALQVGGSFDWVRGHWGVRILKVEYLFSEFDGAALHNARVETGFIFRFK